MLAHLPVFGTGKLLFPDETGYTLKIFLAGTRKDELRDVKISDLAQRYPIS